MVVSEYQGWIIRIAAIVAPDRHWRAEVHVSPELRFAEAKRATTKIELPGTWPDRSTVVLTALELARQYIDLRPRRWASRLRVRR